MIELVPHKQVRYRTLIGGLFSISRARAGSRSCRDAGGGGFGLAAGQIVTLFFSSAATWTSVSAMPCAIEKNN